MSERAAQLLKQAQAGDMEAFTELFETLRPSVHAVAFRVAGPDDAEDVVMETYLKAWQALPRFQGGSSLKTWLYRIAYNCSIDLRRRQERRKECQLEGAGADAAHERHNQNDFHPAPDETIAQEELARNVRKALNELPDEHRTTLLLRYVDGLTCAEVAAATGVSLGTVLSRIFYGKRKLRKILENYEKQV